MTYHLRNYLFIITYLCFFSCSTPPPMWLESRPQDPLYWHGIGFAAFEESENSSALAKEYAIHEISSQIKVNISSQMDIVVTDFNGSVDNAISSVMSSRVDLLLPELEIVEKFSNKSGTYFYIRLNKNKYRVAMERLIENAKATILNYLVDSEKEYGIRSFLLIQKAWKEIIPFTDEPLIVQYNGGNANLYSLIKQKTNEYENRLLIEVELEKNPVRTYIDRDNHILIHVKDAENDRSLPGIPIHISELDSEHVFYTNERGKIKYDIEQSIKPKSYDIKLKLDQHSLYDIDDEFQLAFKPTVHAFNVSVVPSKAAFTSVERNIGEIMNRSIIEPIIKNYFNENLEFVEDTPDIIINIVADTEERSKRMGGNFPYFIFGNASVTFKDALTNENFFSTGVYNIKGADFESKEIAGLRSYDLMSEQLVSKLDESFQ